MNDADSLLPSSGYDVVSSNTGVNVNAPDFALDVVLFVVNKLTPDVVLVAETKLLLFVIV